MSSLQVATEVEKIVQATPAVEIVDCGAVSERTQGVPLLIQFELGTPPTDRLLLL